MKNIKSIKNILLDDSDVWVVSSGASMNHVDPSFFKNKFTIGVNNVHLKFPCSYVVMRDLNDPKFSAGIHNIIKNNIPLIFSKYYQGKDTLNIIDYDNSFFFLHDKINKLEFTDDDHIINTKSTITSAMHIAAYMGAKNILICGHDAGLLDDNLYYDGYDSNIFEKNQKKTSLWWTSIEDQSAKVKRLIEEKYKCNIYSLNPFLNFGLEGHIYERFKISTKIHI